MIDFDSDLGVTAQVLDAIAIRSNVAMHNIANQNTPGFKRLTVEFESLLREANERGEDVRAVRPVVTRDRSGPPGQNNVSVMREMAILDKISLLHEVVSRRAGGYFSHMNKAIRGQG